ncbi:SDR family oxidoreductase [Reinekea blandensis]|uniref:NAD-dependent epimerase/dehydratase family protein n=1 Tax=Reinekea blandensis MED297 TaxID=314283 RepID=A4BHT9_9GAMM|nr:SDR family oxidoreductase [Reinekea blandensis]EAR08344.1 NAD-dependent epimerase/dehydratase family protein [Reinekea sp. MED297] [Reinekea blandensis MED297]
MKTALIIGINGNFGRHMASALRAQGWQIRALMRTPSKAPDWLDVQSIIAGDARDASSVERAAEGVDLLVYAANPPYHRWHQDAMAMLEPAVQAAETRKLQLLFPGNVYAYAPQTNPIDEGTTVNPPTDKGAIRVQMEARLQQAASRGARVLILRAGDFIGPDTEWTWLDLTAKVGARAVQMRFPHNEEHHHYWSYLPDLCANAALLLKEPLGDFEVFHDPGLSLTRADWRQAFAERQISVRESSFPWWGLWLARLASPLMREVWKMRYLWQQPVLMDGRRLITTLGDRRQQTRLADVIDQCGLRPNVVVSVASETH